MRLCLWENIPYVWLSDGYNFMEGLFTKEAVNEFRKNYPHIKFSALRDKMILASKWSLRVRQTDSRKDYTSYQNIHVQIIIEHFKPILHEKPVQRQHQHSKNLFKDEEIQTMIRFKRHQIIQQTIEKQVLYGLNFKEKLTLPSIKDIKKSQNDFQIKQISSIDDDI